MKKTLHVIGEIIGVVSALFALTHLDEFMSWLQDIAYSLPF